LSGFTFATFAREMLRQAQHDVLVFAILV
jgi:hypothetical protein